MNEEIIESVEHRSAPTATRWRFLRILLLSILCLLGVRSFTVQVVQGGSFRERAEHNRIERALIPAPRGIIYDRNRIQLVENVSSTDAVINPRLLPAPEYETYLLERLSQLLPDLSPEEVAQALLSARGTGERVLLRKSLEHEEVLQLQAAQQDILGVELVSSLIRKYPYGPTASHVMGYTGAVSESEMEADEQLVATDSTGKQGLERTYDAALRGQHGTALVEVDAAGRPQVDLGREEPTAGQDLQVSLDIELQEFIYGLFSEREEEKREEDEQAEVSGAVVALDPRSGEVLALVSYPSFDSNIFADPKRNREVRNAFENPDNLLFNRAITGTYPSGSVIKPFLAAAGLEEGIVTEEMTILSTGGISIGPWSFPDWKAGGHGVTDVKKALAESVNTFFYLMTGGSDDFQGLGLARARAYLEAFGWGKPTGVDLPTEDAGFLPTMSWKEEVKGEPWYIGDTYHLGIGQGDVLVTPLQIAYGTAGLANKQELITPHLVNRETIERHPLPVSAQTVQVVREGMRQAVTEGSARNLSELAVPLAGKTGTAQVGGDERTHAWFSSFGPYDTPEMTLVVLLEKGGAGDTDAVPFAREIWQWWIDNRHTP